MSPPERNFPGPSDDRRSSRRGYAARCGRYALCPFLPGIRQVQFLFGELRGLLQTQGRHIIAAPARIAFREEKSGPIRSFKQTDQVAIGLGQKTINFLWL